MKYYVNGRVLPERADVHISYIEHTIIDIGKITFTCQSSQINMTLEVNDDKTIDELSAFLLCKNHAALVVSCLGFTLGCNYSVEIISTTDYKNLSTVHGVQELELKEDETQQFFIDLLKLCERDLFIRFVIMDFIKAITSEVESAFLCYRAIETIKSRFRNDLLSDQSSKLNDKEIDEKSWALMHSSLGTTRQEFDRIKPFADPIRHGNYYDLAPTNSQQRMQILLDTKTIILRYKSFLEKKHKI